MDVGELFALLRRRWAVLLPMLALTAIAIAGAWVKIPTQYQSQVQLTMYNAEKVTNAPGNDGNPYLAFDTTLGVDVDFLARNISSGASAQQLAAQGMGDQYTAGLANNALGPFMQLSVTGRNPQQVTQSIKTLISFTEQRWRDLQKATLAPTNSIIGMGEIAPPSTPAPVLKRKAEVVTAVAVAGLVASCLVAIVADNIVRRRGLRYRARATESSAPVSGEPAGPIGGQSARTSGGHPAMPTVGSQTTRPSSGAQSARTSGGHSISTESSYRHSAP